MKYINELREGNRMSGVYLFANINSRLLPKTENSTKKT